MGIDTATERDSTFSDRVDDRVSASVVVVGAIAGLVVLATAFWVLWSGVGHGFDVTDEGFYLRSADAPGPEYAFVGLWGAYLHPLFWATGFDIAKYRALGIVLLACAALLQSYGLRRALAGRFDRPPAPGRTGLLVRVCLDMAVVAGALTYYSLFLVTPSYNWLTLVGVLVCSGGALALLAPARGTRWDLVDPVLVAVGSLLALASRPTAGIGLWVAVTVLVLAVSSRPTRRRLTDLAVVVAATLVLGVVHLLFISGWSNTLAIIRRTMYVGQNDIGGHSLPDLIHSSGHQVKFIVPGVWHLVGAWPLAGFVVLAAALVPVAVRARVAGLLGAGSIVAVTVAIWVNGGFRGGHGVQFLLPFAGFALIFTALAVAVSSTVLQLLPGAASPRAAVLMRSWRVLVCGLFLLATALLYTFSSNNGLIYQLWGGFGVLALVALFLLAAGLETKALPVVAGTMAVVCASVALTVLSQASKSPYDTPPVAEDTTRITVSGHGATLLTSPDYAAALESFRSQAVAGGWKAGTPLIDLTPFFPGIGYMLDARPPTTIMTGFAPEVAAWTLAQQDRAAFREAWVLVKANNAPRPLKALSVLGRTFPDDYVRVASVEYPLGHTQLELWRPSTP